AIDGVGAVAFLGAETLRMNHDHAVLGHALAGEPVEPRRGIGRQRDPAGIETQLRGGRKLVDVLSAWSRGADEADLDVVLVDCEVAGNPQHGVTEPDDPRGESGKQKIAGLSGVCCAGLYPFPPPLRGRVREGVSRTRRSSW